MCFLKLKDIEMNTNIFLVALIIILTSSPLQAANSSAISRYPFENHFSMNADISVGKVKTQFGEAASEAVFYILDDISFKGGNDTKLIYEFRDLGFSTIPVLDRAMRNIDPEIRKRATWMAVHMVYIKENRKPEYSVIEESLSWLFCRMILDVDDNVKKEALKGLHRIMYEKLPKSPMPRGAVEGFWLYKLTVPYSSEYSERIKQFDKFKLPVPDSDFLYIWVDSEIQKAGIEASTGQDCDANINQQTNKK